MVLIWNEFMGHINENNVHSKITLIRELKTCCEKKINLEVVFDSFTSYIKKKKEGEGWIRPLLWSRQNWVICIAMKLDTNSNRILKFGFQKISKQLSDLCLPLNDLEKSLRCIFQIKYTSVHRIKNTEDEYQYSKVNNGFVR